MNCSAAIETSLQFWTRRLNWFRPTRTHGWRENRSISQSAQTQDPFMQPLRPSSPRTLMLPEPSPSDGSTLPCASATTSASLAGSGLFLLRELVQAALGYLAPIYTWTGDKDLALEQLAKAAQLPSNLNYGWLRLHPDWDLLRGDPRFEKIVASLAPK